MKEMDHGRILREMAKKTRVMKPAIAGVVIDNEVDYKEVFSTFVHLAVWGHIQVLPGRKFVRTGKEGRLAGFESLVLDSVFPDDVPVPEGEVGKRLKSVNLHEFSGYVLDELIGLGLAESSATVSLFGPSRDSRITKQMDIIADGKRIAPGSMPEGEPSDVLIRKSTVSQSRSAGAAALSDVIRGPSAGSWKGGLLGFLKGLLGMPIKFEAKTSSDSFPGDMEPRGSDGRIFSISCSTMKKEVMTHREIKPGNMGFRPSEGMGELLRKAREDGMPGAHMSVMVNGKEVTDPKELKKYSGMLEGWALEAPTALESGGFSFRQTKKAEKIVAGYLELQDFLKRFPCAEDRFSNPFVAYNIAFHLREFNKLPS